MQAPVQVALLRELGAPHLPPRQSADLSDDSVYDQALQWATRDINPTVALLQRERPGCFVVFDYALDILTGQGEPIPDATWPILIQNAEPDDLIRIGYAARVLFGKPEIALEAWRAAANSGSPDNAPGAEFNLGLLLAEQGDVDGAKAAYQRAIDSGHSEEAPRGAFALGLMLIQHGDVDGAKAAFQRAIDSGHREHGPAALVSLAGLLGRQGDTAQAQTLFQQALDSGDADIAAAATIGLGLTLAEEGDIEGAKTAYQRVIDSGLPCPGGGELPYAP